MAVALDCDAMAAEEPRRTAQRLALLRDERLAAAVGLATRSPSDALWRELEGTCLDAACRVQDGVTFEFARDLGLLPPLVEEDPGSGLRSLWHAVDMGRCWVGFRLRRAQAPELFETLELLWAEAAAEEPLLAAAARAVRSVVPATLTLGVQPAATPRAWGVLVRGGDSKPSVRAPDFVEDLRVRRFLGSGPERRWLVTGTVVVPAPGAHRAGQLHVDGTSVPIAVASAHQFRSATDTLTCSRDGGAWAAAADLLWQGAGEMPRPTVAFAGVDAGFVGQATVLGNGPHRLRVLVSVRRPGVAKGSGRRIVLRVPGEEDPLELPLRAGEW